MTTTGVSVFVPGLRVQSEQNLRERWWITHARKKAQQQEVFVACLTKPDSFITLRSRPTATLRVVMTRVIGPRGRQFDTDNLASSFKHVRDAVASWLKRDDSPTSGIEWVTAQERGEEYGVRIDITEVQP